MTFRRQLILMFLAIALLTILLNTLIIGQVVDRSFKSYVEEQYDEKIEEVTEYARYVLTDGAVRPERVSSELRNYIGDLITGIAIYDANNQPVVQLWQNTNTHMMMERSTTEDFVYTVSDGSETVGYILVRRFEAFGESPASQIFRLAVLRISGQALLITFLVSLMAITLISKRLTRDLNRTASMAEHIDAPDALSYKASKTREISSIQKTLADLAGKLRIRQRLRKEKADQLAHEARTPLTIIKSGLEGVRDGIIDLDDEHVTLWIEQVDRLSGMVGDIGSILHLEEEGPRVEQQEVDLKALLEKVIRSFRPQFDRRGVALGVAIEGEGEPVMTDPALLSQSLYNVLTNALKFTPKGGRVTVALSISEGKSVLRVSDTGPGLHEDEHDAVFEAYRRGENAAEVPGDGMGLYIVRKNLEALGGTVHLETSEDSGLTVVMTL